MMTCWLYGIVDYYKELLVEGDWYEFQNPKALLSQYQGEFTNVTPFLHFNWVMKWQLFIVSIHEEGQP
jgi:hypothetical protein